MEPEHTGCCPANRVIRVMEQIYLRFWNRNYSNDRQHGAAEMRTKMKQKGLHKNLHRLLLFAFVLSLATGFLAACGGKGKGAGTSAEENRTTFTVGFDAEFPPYGYKDEDGEYVGFDLDLAAEVSKRNDWRFVKQPVDWDSKDMELNSGAIDCIWNGFTMNGREKEYTWSTAYIDNSQVVIVGSGSDIQKLSDLSGKVVVVQADSSALAAFTGEDASEENKELCEKFEDLQQVSDYNSAFMNLEAGSVDAICMDIGVANYQIKQRGDAFRMLDERVSSEQYGIGFKLGNTALRDTVQESLNEMLADGTFAEIAEKWELTDCICLGEEGTDSAYLQDAGKKSDESFGKKFVDIVKRLSGGMLASLIIFVLTLVFSMPLGLLICMVDVEICYFTMDCEDLYFYHARNTIDAAASCCIFRTILCVWRIGFSNLSVLCSNYWLFIKLCGVFC